VRPSRNHPIPPSLPPVTHLFSLAVSVSESVARVCESVRPWLGLSRLLCGHRRHDATLIVPFRPRLAPFHALALLLHRLLLPCSSLLLWPSRAAPASGSVLIPSKQLGFLGGPGHRIRNLFPFRLMHACSPLPRNCSIATRVDVAFSI
jgi:hypothetical protein